MRAQGVLTEPICAGAADHVCWVHDSAGALAAVAAGFLAGGRARGDRLMVVADDEVVGRLTESPGVLGPLDVLVDGDALTLLPPGGASDGAAGFLPEQQLAFYAEATRRARADGYQGLRVVADVTPLAADGHRRDRLVRWEHLADRLIATGSGFTAMCAYRREALGEDALADVAAVHPLVHPPDGLPPEDAVPFRVFFDGDRVALAGCVDACGADRLRRVLADSPADDAEVAVLDLSRLELADAAGCRAILSWARDRAARGRRVQLVGASRLFARVWRLLGYDEVAGVTLREGTA